MGIQRTSLNVSLAPELERFIAARAAPGRCRTAGGVVRAAPRPPERSGSQAPAPAPRGGPASPRDPGRA